MKKIFILHVDQQLVAFKPDAIKKECELAKPGDFIGFVLYLKDKYPDYKLRCIHNEKIENYLRKKIKHQKQKEEYKVLNNLQINLVR